MIDVVQGRTQSRDDREERHCHRVRPSRDGERDVGARRGKAAAPAGARDRAHRPTLRVGRVGRPGYGRACPRTALSRVVSLVPSITETLSSWDVTPVACTRFCERPDLPHVGGTKDPDIDDIVALAPDLVVRRRRREPP